MAEQAQLAAPGNFMHQLLSNGFNVNSLRNNALLRKDEWKELDETVVEVARSRLTGIQDLQDNNLVLPLGGLGTLMSQYEAQSDMTDADINMSGVTGGEEDSVEFDLRNVPIPIIHKDFRINIRRLEASRRLGDGIDTTQAAVAARKVAEKNEDILFNGAGVTIDGNTLYGYTNHPQVNTGSLNDWSSIDNIHSDVLSMVEDAFDAHYYGPFYLYVGADEWSDMLQVYTDGSGQTALERVMNIPQIQQVRHSGALDDGQAVLVQMTSDVVDLAIAQDVTTVQWETVGGMQAHFKVMNALAPRIKHDYNDRCGIVFYD